MDNFYLDALVREIQPEIEGRRVARLHARGAGIVIDLKLPDERVLVASLDPSSPALYIAQPTRESVPPSQSPFVLSMRKKLTRARVISLEKAANDRIVRIEFQAPETVWLVLMLTGASANAYLTDQDMRIESAFAKRGRLRPGEQLSWSHEPSTLAGGVTEPADANRIEGELFGAGSVFGPLYKTEFIARAKAAGPAAAFESLMQDLFKKSPPPLVYSRLPLEMAGRRLLDPKRDLILSYIELEHARGLLRQQFSSLSQAADEYYRARGRARTFADEFDTTRRLVAREMAKCESALSSIANDRARFQDPERFKRFGDLILANLQTARVAGAVVSLVDYYDPEQATIRIEIESGETLQHAASRYFSRYQQAKRGLAAVVKRESEITARLELFKDLSKKLQPDASAEGVRESGDRIRDLVGAGARRRLKHASKASPAEASGGQAGRRFVSSDGYEVVVGRNDLDNDRITFRLARSRDVWLHAADYAGSHVIIRNPRSDDVPQRSVLEAAELAAFYSQAKHDSKVAVHSTLKKFVSKPPRAKPGLVRLSSFKTLLVEPRCKLEKLT